MPLNLFHAPGAGQPVLRSSVMALLLVTVGALLAYLCLTTAFVPSLAARAGTSSMLRGSGGSSTLPLILALTFAVVAPAGFLSIGLARAWRLVRGGLSGRALRVTGLAAALGGEHVVVPNLVLPGGRVVEQLVLGQFGILVLHQAPPLALTRQMGYRWEVRDRRAGWISIEPPLDQATRDAEQVRRWLTAEDRDFLVKVRAAVISDDALDRTSTCLVVPSRDLVAWIRALPPQRGLTAPRMTHLAAEIRASALNRR